MDLRVLRILHLDPHLVIVEKPAGFHVHPPEDKAHRISKQWSVLSILRDQMGHPVYPIHRLDRPTSGVLVMGRSAEAASRMAALFRDRQIEKSYYACVRGWPGQERFQILRPLGGKKQGSALKEARTDVEILAKCTLPFQSHARFPETRITLLRLRPHTGRFHQIRRHLGGEGYPLIGDSMHGDTKFNRLFQEHWKSEGLWLKAYRLAFIHPWTNEQVVARSRWDGRWHRLFDQMGMCPRE